MSRLSPTVDETLFRVDGTPDPTRLRAALEALRAAEPALGPVMDQVPCTLELSVLHNPYRALGHAIIGQQISGAAARAIQEKVRLHFRARHFPTPAQLCASTPEALRTAGLSRTKALSLMDLAEKTREGVVPALGVLRKLSDEAIIDRLRGVRGVGVWTVQMMLIFRLGRADVLAATDYGVRKGFGKLFLRGRLPTPEQVERRGARWAPFRTLASWYLY